MLYCKSCGYEFNDAQKISEKHGFTSPPYENLMVCPNCKSQDIHEKITTHCRCCGARLSKNTYEYCSDACKRKGEALRRIEQRRRNQLYKSALSELVRQVDTYNKEHKTNYSYGQYVAIILPKERAKNKKCTKKRKNI